MPEYPYWDEEWDESEDDYASYDIVKDAYDIEDESYEDYLTIILIQSTSY